MTKIATPLKVAAFDLDVKNKTFSRTYETSGEPSPFETVKVVRDAENFFLDALGNLDAQESFDAALVDAPGDPESDLAKAVGNLGSLFEAMREINGHEPVLVSLMTHEESTAVSLYEVLKEIGDGATHVVALNTGKADKNDQNRGGSGFPFYDGDSKEQAGACDRRVKALGGHVWEVPALKESTAVEVAKQCLPFHKAATKGALKAEGGSALTHMANVIAFNKAARATFAPKVRETLERIRSETGRKPVLIIYSTKGGVGKSFTARLLIEALRGQL